MASTLDSGEIMVGRLGPYTSASKMPTLAPIWARVKARLTAVVDLPTPVWFGRGCEVEHLAVWV